MVKKDEFQTKKELGEKYGMKAASGIGKEWDEQIQFLEEYVIGKTAEEVAGIAVDDSTKSTDVDLVAGVTIKIGDYKKAIVEAAQNAEAVGTQEGKFDTAGKITSDVKSGVKTKRQLGDDYGMKAASGIGKEWFEQAANMEDYLAGKNAGEVTGIAVDGDGKPTDPDLLAGVTISVDGYQTAAVKAMENAK